jgi:hypothetical protein
VLTEFLFLVAMKEVTFRECSYDFIIMMTELLAYVSLVMVVFVAYTQALAVFFIDNSLPTIDPYIPRAKRPPNYLGRFLDWLNLTIELTVDYIVPLMPPRRRCSSRSRHSSAKWSPIVPLCWFFRILLNCLRCDVLLWHHEYLFCKWHFLWWNVRRRRSPSRTARLALSVVTTCVARANSATPRPASRAIFDSDSFDILIDGGATACISNDLGDFISPPRPSKVRVKGFNGASSSTRIGTVRWSLLDDSGRRHTLQIPNTYYVHDCPMRLLSPQHYSQETNDLRGTFSTNFGDQVVFTWNHNRFKATMPLSGVSNVGILRSAPGHKIFSCYVAASSESTTPPTFFACAVLPDSQADAFELAYGEGTPSDTVRLEGEDENEDEEFDSYPASTPGAPGKKVSFADSIADAAPEHPAERPAVLPFDLDHDDSATNLASHDDALSNLDPSTELLRWHYRLGHLPFANIQLMAKRGEIPKRLGTCRVPKCQSCLYGRATKKPWRTKGSAGKVKTVTKPGECVSVDQLESPVPGFVGQSKGYFFRKRYGVATIFVDHFSRLSFVHLHESTKGEETLLAKKAFEAYAASFGVTVKHYHADNGRFAEALFLNHAQQLGQGVSLCGVNAHFQNGIAEKRIRDLTERARTSLLHAINQWPSAISLNLWPYALRFANDVHNATPSIKTGRSPLEDFSTTPVRPQVLNFHPIFCPAYVLHSYLQGGGGGGGGGKKPNKWVRRSRLAIYLGFSPRHARSVSLVLSLSTGYVSPQFHVKCDDFFETVQDTKSLPPSKWQFFSWFVTESGLPYKPLPTPSSRKNTTTRDQEKSPSTSLDAAPELPTEDIDESSPMDFDFDNQDDEGADDLLPLEVPRDSTDDVALPIPPLPPDSSFVTPPSPRRIRPTEPTRRSTRNIKPPNRLIETAYAVFDDTDAVEDYEAQSLAEDPIAFASSKSDPDTLYYNEAMNASDAMDFKAAMLREVDAHTANDHWEVWAKCDVPAGQDILPAVWAFKRKRRIDTRAVYKYKARLNIHGGMQTHGVNYWETYSPVVNWFSIRLALILALLFGWHTRQIDFVLAFPQADVECDLFMQLPRGVIFPGIHRSTHCLKLKKNLYGQKQAGRVWNLHLVNGLVNMLLENETCDARTVSYLHNNYTIVNSFSSHLIPPIQNSTMVLGI